MVKVKYGQIYLESFGKKEENIKANSLGELLDKIEDKYNGIKYADKLRKISLIILNYKTTLNKKEDLEKKLTSKDEVLITAIMGGG